MSEREVAERYAELRGLSFVGKGTLPVRSPWLGGDLRCMNAITGPVADIVQGIVFESTGPGAGGLIGRPSAQFEIAGLSEAVDGLWVRRSGGSIWTRVKLPRGYKEMLFSNEAFMARYRVAASADRDGSWRPSQHRDRLGDLPLVGRLRPPGECSAADGPTRRLAQRQRGCRLLSWPRGA